MPGPISFPRGIAGFNALSIHGADIASASTIDLDSATGDIIDVTGSATINAVTLSEGKRRILRFTGGAVLAVGASLILPTNSAITTAAGDFAFLVGYPGGVVRCASYLPFSGQALSLRNSFAPSPPTTNALVKAKDASDPNNPITDSQVTDDGSDISLPASGSVNIDPAIDANITPGGNVNIAITGVAANINMSSANGDILASAPNGTYSIDPKNGLFVFQLPTSDPAQTGRLWRDPITNVILISP